MKILIADKLAQTAIDELSALGCEIDFQPDLSADELPNVAGDANVIIVRSTKVQAPAIDAAPELKLIIRAGAGYNTIDTEHANTKGVYVCNTPGKNAAAVAELAIGLMIAADRNILNAGTTMRNGQWEKKKFGTGYGLLGRTFGIVGLGTIGLEVANRAKALGMNVIAWSRSLTPERAQELGFQFASSPLEVAKAADVVSPHVAYNDATHHLLNAEFFNAMRDGAIVLNTSRGEVVDTQALIEAINTKGLKAAVDVYENEPTGGKAEFPQTEFAAVATCTPHLGASSAQAAEAVAQEVIRIVKAYKENSEPVNIVNNPQL